ncbi:ABC transporter ATP-binding protein [Pectobacterium fontis]|uniref:Sulfonate ABC transporter ATP-binding protein n=1 Tax=Pectobacterium fontis TaxID=2558042 RepID=A0A7V8IIX9_9GAMM|nr:ABC transporter ATP-binding protein [Pectobacterium fontis]KHN51910.1 sulfonate ABC transporter ATP-binding protein [Pectobacterium fontis]
MKVETNKSVKVENLTRAYSEKVILDAIDLHIPSGQFVSLLGKSGSGKSTLLRALAGLDETVSGQGAIHIPLNYSVMFQDSRLLPWENVISNVRLGVESRYTFDDAKQVLSLVGLEHRTYAWPSELSGGEQQRVALARSLIRHPSLVLADEPFGALDALTRIKMQKLLLALFAEISPTVVLVTHDVDEALILSDRILVLDNGKIIEDFMIDISHPRRTYKDEFEQYRKRLLQLLGVNEVD